jgi:L-lactate dehydrogenase complex protein LldE
VKIALFVPCYVDQFYPRVGLAAVDVLERFGCEVVFPEAQTCCGQPMANTGCVELARPLAEKFFDVFREFEHVVCPSGSCTAMVRRHYHRYVHGHPEEAAFEALCGRTFELCEFLHDVLGVRGVEGSFPHRVGLHQSCHGLRELRLASDSERVTESFNKARTLLESLEGITFGELDRPDECCGFGGTFAVGEEAVSCVMGNDRLDDHGRAGTEVLTAVDMSCLMHLEGLARRQRRPVRVMHVAEILAESRR